MIDAAHAFNVLEASHPDGELKRPARPRHEHHPFLRGIVARFRSN